MNETLKMKNIHIETFIREIQEGSIAALKDSIDLPVKVKAAIYRLSKKITEDSATKAYLEQKQQLGQDLDAEKKTQEEIDKDFQELLDQDSGLEIERPTVSEEDLLSTMSVNDLIKCDWLFNIEKAA